MIMLMCGPQNVNYLTITHKFHKGDRGSFHVKGSSI